MRTIPIDITFDFRTDANGGDPDKTSATLKKYHKVLWSKTLPNGHFFDLDSNSGNGYLYHKSDLGEFVLASDTVLPTFLKQLQRQKYSSIFEQIPEEEVENFEYITYTIGGIMIFPGNRIDGCMTINGARGCHPRIADRFDLTVECIRRYYAGEESPLQTVLARYDSFFRLFENFKNYVDFFLLKDLLIDDSSAIRFFSPFDNFNSSPIPASLESYLSFRGKTIDFVECRNNRIANLFK
ncbi:MAG: hypothetical protein ABIP78_09355 [Pyrinomonadaceae bacterium]